MTQSSRSSNFASRQYTTASYGRHCQNSHPRARIGVSFAYIIIPRPCTIELSFFIVTLQRNAWPYVRQRQGAQNFLKSRSYNFYWIGIDQLVEHIINQTWSCWSKFYKIYRNFLWMSSDINAFFPLLHLSKTSFVSSYNLMIQFVDFYLFVFQFLRKMNFLRNWMLHDNINQQLIDVDSN